ncbi:hypothetical protein TNCV_1413191 [Trichonephila clavipes]|nr:hypothetical protein TNCV_1413191 [Trichonephila clavipes]
MPEPTSMFNYIVCFIRYYKYWHDMAPAGSSAATSSDSTILFNVAIRYQEERRALDHLGTIELATVIFDKITRKGIINAVRGDISVPVTYCEPLSVF